MQFQNECIFILMTSLPWYTIGGHDFQIEG